MKDLIDRLASSITLGDGEDAAELWEMPAYVVGPDLVMVLDRPDAIAQLLGEARESYNAYEIQARHPEILGEEWIGERLVTVRVRWPYVDAAGREIGAERCDYTLRRGDTGALAIRSVLMRGFEGANARPPS